MKVKDIILKTAEYLNLDDVIIYINSDDENNDSLNVENELKDLKIAVNMINNIIASNYMELVKVNNYNISNGKIGYSEFDNNIIEIKKVKDKNNCEIPYKLVSGGILIDSDFASIEYSYFPDKVELDDEIDDYTKLNVDIFAIGVVGEYLFLKGDLDYSNIWDRKFKDLLCGIVRPRRSVNMPINKRWI